MKMKLILCASAMAICALELGATNLVPGTTVAVSVTSVDGVQDSNNQHVGPYGGTVGGNPYTIFCDDLDHNIGVGSSINMKVSAINDLSLTRFGGASASTTLTAMVSYEKIFYLSSFLVSATTNDRKDIQDAMWSYFTNGAHGNPSSAAITGWETKATDNYQGKDYSSFRILTDAGNQYSGNQELFVTTLSTLPPGLTSTPEPGTWAMLLSGLGGVAVMRLRRNKA